MTTTVDAQCQVGVTVRPGSRWRHKNGNIYTVLYLANEHADESKREEYPLRVVYRGQDGNVWDKEQESFLRSLSQIDD